MIAIQQNEGDEIVARSKPSVAERDRSGDIARSQQLAHNMTRRIVIATLAAVPLCALLFAGLVALATTMAGVSVVMPIIAGAGVGMLAGLFCGMWTGVVLSVNEVEAVERHSRAEHAAHALREPPTDVDVLPSYPV